MNVNRVSSLLFAVAAIATLMMTSCGEQSPEALMASAKEQLAKGERSAAVIQLKNVLTRVPDSGEARLLLGEAMLDAGDYAAAEKELSRALDLKQPQERVVPLYVRALLAQGKYRAVVTEVEKYRLFDPSAVAATQTALGDAQRGLGNRPRARDAYAGALEAVPGYPRARLGEAMLTASEGRVDDALMQTGEIIAAEPKLLEARQFRAELLLAKGDQAGAMTTLEEAISANPAALPLRLLLISLLIDKRDFESAARLLDDTRKVAPRDLRVTYYDASLAFRRGENDKANQHVQQVLKYMPEHVPSLALAGALELKGRRLQAAETHLRKAVAKAPNHYGARLLLVQTYLQMGQPAKAKDALQPLIDRGVPNERRLLLLAGETFLANGDLPRATSYFQAAAQGADDQEVAARTRLGQIALITGRAEEGFRELEAASELGSAMYQADLALIVGHLRRNELDKAMAAVDALEKKQPASPLTFQMYGVVNTAKGNIEAARKNFEKALELQPTYLAAAHSLAQLDILARRPDDAVKRLQAMVAKDPKNEQALRVLAEVQAQTGADPKDVRATLERAISANPQSASSRLALVDLLLRSGDPKAALTVAQAALAAFPSEPRVLDAAGVAQEAAGEVNQAIDSYNKLASLQPQAVQPLYRLAALYLRQQDAAKAIESLRRIQRIAPRNGDALVQLVEVYVASSRYDEALKEARELQKVEPKAARGFSLEGDIYFMQRKFADAERMYREALKRSPRAGAIAVKYYSAMLGAGKGVEAEAWAKKWMADNPRDVALHVNLAERAVVAKNLKVAAAQYQAVIGIEPDNASALNNLAWIGAQLGEPNALGFAERAVKIAPNDPSILDTYGILLVKRGESAKALQVLERARALAPARNDLRVSYAKALIAAGKKAEARKELEALLAVKDNYSGKDEVAGLLKGL